MSIASALGLDRRQVRYAVVGAGDIAQAAMMPGIDHTGNSKLVAIVSGDPVKLGVLGERYGVDHQYSYDQFDEMIASGNVDAIYLATPNGDMRNSRYPHSPPASTCCAKSRWKYPPISAARYWPRSRHRPRS